MRQSNADVFEKAYRALIAGDADTAGQLLSPDVRVFLSGRSIVSGDYRGIEPALRFFQNLVSRTDATLHREFLDLLAGETHAAALVHVTGRHGARLLDINLITVAEIRDEKVVELQVYQSDQHAWDEFWSDQRLTAPLPAEFKPIPPR